MDHNEAQESFLDYLEDKLSEQLKGEFDTHLSGCEDCRSRFERYQQLISLEQVIAGEQASAGNDFSVKVMDRIESSEGSFFEVISRRFLMGKRIMVSGATLAVVVLAIIIGKSQVEDIRKIHSLDLASAPVAEEIAKKSNLSTIEKSLDQAGLDREDREEAQVEREVFEQIVDRAVGQGIVLEQALKRGEGDGRIGSKGYSAGSEQIVAKRGPSKLKAPVKLPVKNSVKVPREKAAAGKAEQEFSLEKPSKAREGGSISAQPLSAPREQLALGDRFQNRRALDKSRVDSNKKVLAVEERKALGRGRKRVMAASAAKPAQVAKDRSEEKEAYQDVITAFKSDIEQAKNQRSRESQVTDHKKLPSRNVAVKQQKPGVMAVSGLTGATNSQVRTRDYDGEMTSSSGKKYVLRAGKWHPVDGKPEAQRYPQASGEVYAEYQENPRVTVSEDPRSTFGLDVDTGSYANIRRFLSMGRTPPKNSVRIEELVNYFHYEYPSEDDKAFGVNYEIAPMPFSAGRYLLKLGVKARESRLHDEVGWNLIFLIDLSGSMDTANKLPLLKRSLPLLVEKMTGRDRIAIVTYSDSARLSLAPTSGAEKEKILGIIRGLRAGGSTNGSGGINLAYDLAKKHYQKHGVNRVILATDGDFNVGVSSFDGLLKLIKEKRESGITLSVLGFGQGNLKEKTMEQLADRGNGNYFYIDSFREARKVLADELAANVQVVAKDVKVQVEFNPEHVLEYRLIGYDNRKLAHQDFTNDRVDSGEVGSGRTVTVLYELVLKGTPLAEKLNSQLRYQRGEKESTGQVSVEYAREFAFVKIRYKEPKAKQSRELSIPLLRTQIKETLEETSADFRFAAAVSAFGHLLRGSNYLGDYSFEDVLKLARGALGEDSRGHRHEFLSLVENAASIR